MTKENKFKIGLYLQEIALSMDDATLEKNRERLKLIEDIIAGEQEQKPKIFKALCMIKSETMKKYQREIIKQMEEGVVLLPNCFELVEDNLDLLDKIRAEIDIARFIDKDTKLCKNANASGLEVTMEIIDKYKAESEET